MATKDKQDCEFAVGDKLKIELHDGRIVDATVRAIVDDGEGLQVDFAHEETALVKVSQSNPRPLLQTARAASSLELTRTITSLFRIAFR
jgi:hypothetical protein